MCYITCGNDVKENLNTVDTFKQMLLRMCGRERERERERESVCVCV